MEKKNKLNIFIFEPVPLLNKGEEAIVKGIEALFDTHYDVDMTVLDWTEHSYEQNGIKALPALDPYKLINTKSSGLKLKIQILKHFFSRILGINLQSKTIMSNPSYTAHKKAFMDADLILVGHDGIFGLEQESFINFAKQHSKVVGILGCGLYPMRRHKWLYANIYKRAVKQSFFAFFREHSSFEYMKEIGAEQIDLAPDPAFIMKADRKDMNRFEHVCDQIVVTVCEKSIIYDGAFVNLNGDKKRDFHRQLLAELLDHAAFKSGRSVYFLPHSIEDGVGNDVQIAKSIASKMNSSATVIEDDLSSGQLKQIIKDAQFLVAERTHSMIGAVSVATPFLGLTSSADRRTHEIIGLMSSSEDALFDLDNASVPEIIRKFDQTYDEKSQTRNKLKMTANEHQSKLKKVASRIITCLNENK